MKLYYSPGACSLSPHIVLREAGMDFEIERVDLGSHLTETGAELYRDNAVVAGLAAACWRGSPIHHQEVLVYGEALEKAVCHTHIMGHAVEDLGEFGRIAVVQAIEIIRQNPRDFCVTRVQGSHCWGHIAYRVNARIALRR